MVEETRYSNFSVYIEGYLSKKEEKWVEFWVVLEDRYLMIHSSKPIQSNGGRYDRLIGWIEITNQTKCIMGKKKSYSFPFYIQTKNGKYLFKTPSTLLRHQWVKAIELSSQGKSPEYIPKSLSQIDRCMEGNDERDNKHDERDNKHDERDNKHDERDNENNDIEERPLIHNELNEAYENDYNENLIHEEFECVNEEDESSLSNVILVTTGCENTKTFLWKNDLNNRETLMENERNPNHENGKTKKNNKFHYEQPTISYSLQPPSSTNGISKSVECVKELDVLDSYRTNSDTSVRSPRKNNCHLFSRHLINEKLSGDEMLTVS